MVISKGITNQGWYLDDEDTHYLTNNIHYLAKDKHYLGSHLLLVGNGQVLKITHTCYNCFYTSLRPHLKSY